MRRHKYTMEIEKIYHEWLAVKTFTLKEEQPGSTPRPVRVEPGSKPESTYEWVQVSGGTGGYRLVLRDKKGLDQIRLFSDALRVSFMWRDVALAHMPPTATEASEINLPDWLKTLSLGSTFYRAAVDYYRDQNGRIRTKSKKVPQSKRMKAVSRRKVEDEQVSVQVTITDPRDMTEYHLDPRARAITILKTSSILWRGRRQTDMLPIE